MLTFRNNQAVDGEKFLDGLEVALILLKHNLMQLL